MSEYYNLDAIKTGLDRDIDINTAYLNAWKKVSFPTKKDGKPFAVMSKNIDGAKYTLESYAMQPGEYELTVYTRCSSAGYVHDTIKAYEIVRYLKDAEMLAKTQNYQPKQTYLEQVYTYDIDDIKKAVARRIEYLESYIEDLKNQKIAADRIFNNFRTAYENAMKQLETDCKPFMHNDLFYAVRDCVKNRYPYC